MSGNRNRGFALAFTLSNLGSFIKLAELIFGGGHGAEKKAAVLDVVGATLQAGLGVVAQNNPKYGQIIGEVGTLIDAKVTEMQGTGELPPAVIPPTPIDIPPAGNPDPTAHEYDTKEAAEAATNAAYPFVIKKGNGKFVVWPTVGPFPGEKVYP